MHRNVVIRYAPIVACYHHAFDEGSYNISQNMYGDLQDWIRIAPRVWVWYYALPRTKLHPYPNLKCLSRNFNRMRDAGVKGFFIQAEVGQMLMAGGMTELQAYLFAKLIWNPDYNVHKGIQEFSTACYGPAAPQIISFIRIVNDADTYTGTPADYKHMTKFPGLHLACSAQLTLKKEKLRLMDALFDKAERAVADQPEALRRVRLMRLPLQYAIMLYTDQSAPIRDKAIRAFFPLARQADVQTLRNPKNDRQEDLDTFRKNFLGL